MDAQDFRSLQEAYMDVVMNEGLGGAKNQGDYEEREKERQRVRDEHLRKYKSGELPFQKQKKADQAQEFLKKHPRKKRTQQEQADIYDIILSHLLDEGYAETPESAEVIMVNMSEEWRDSIIG
jgi:DNA-directed RNA polymerase specialized sigma54-like protein